MPRAAISPSEALLVGVVILGVAALAPSIAGGVTENGIDGTTGASLQMTANQTTANISVDCNETNVSITAPSGYEYDVTVGVANVTPESSSVSSSSFGGVEGNATVDFDERGIVFTIVQNESEEVVASDVTYCGDAAAPTMTTATNETERPEETEPERATEPEIEVDCEAGEVRFVAAEDTDYVAKVSVIELSATGTSTSSSTMTLSGNETVSVESDGIVAAFASTDDLGDDRTVSVLRNCSPFGADANETTTVETTTDETETES